MNIEKKPNQHSDETRLALLEQAIKYLKNELMRLEERIDKLQYKCE